MRSAQAATADHEALTASFDGVMTDATLRIDHNHHNGVLASSRMLGPSVMPFQGGDVNATDAKNRAPPPIPSPKIHSVGVANLYTSAAVVSSSSGPVQQTQSQQGSFGQSSKLRVLLSDSLKIVSPTASCHNLSTMLPTVSLGIFAAVILFVSIAVAVLPVDLITNHAVHGTWEGTTRRMAVQFLTESAHRTVNNFLEASELSLDTISNVLLLGQRGSAASYAANSAMKPVKGNASTTGAEDLLSWIQDVSAEDTNATALCTRGQWLLATRFNVSLSAVDCAARYHKALRDASLYLSTRPNTTTTPGEEEAVMTAFTLDASVTIWKAHALAWIAPMSRLLTAQLSCSAFLSATGNTSNTIDPITAQSPISAEMVLPSGHFVSAWCLKNDSLASGWSIGLTAYMTLPLPENQTYSVRPVGLMQELVSPATSVNETLAWLTRCAVMTVPVEESQRNSTTCSALVLDAPVGVEVRWRWAVAPVASSSIPSVADDDGVPRLNETSLFQTIQLAVAVAANGTSLDLSVPFVAMQGAKPNPSGVSSSSSSSSNGIFVNLRALWWQAPLPPLLNMTPAGPRAWSVTSLHHACLGVPTRKWRQSADASAMAAMLCVSRLPPGCENTLHLTQGLTTLAYTPGNQMAIQFDVSAGLVTASTGYRHEVFASTQASAFNSSSSSPYKCSTVTSAFRLPLGGGPRAIFSQHILDMQRALDPFHFNDQPTHSLQSNTTASRTSDGSNVDMWDVLGTDTVELYDPNALPVITNLISAALTQFNDSISPAYANAQGFLQSLPQDWLASASVNLSIARSLLNTASSHQRVVVDASLSGAIWDLGLGYAIGFISPLRIGIFDAVFDDSTTTYGEFLTLVVCLQTGFALVAGLTVIVLLRRTMHPLIDMRQAVKPLDTIIAAMMTKKRVPDAPRHRLSGALLGGPASKVDNESQHPSLRSSQLQEDGDADERLHQPPRDSYSYGRDDLGGSQRVPLARDWAPLLSHYVVEVAGWVAEFARLRWSAKILLEVLRAQEQLLSPLTTRGSTALPQSHEQIDLSTQGPFRGSTRLHRSAAPMGGDSAPRVVMDSGFGLPVAPPSSTTRVRAGVTLNPLLWPSASSTLQQQQHSTTGDSLHVSSMVSNGSHPLINHASSVFQQVLLAGATASELPLVTQATTSTAATSNPMLPLQTHAQEGSQMYSFAADISSTTSSLPQIPPRTIAVSSVLSPSSAIEPAATAPTAAPPLPSPSALPAVSLRSVHAVLIRLWFPLSRLHLVERELPYALSHNTPHQHHHHVRGLGHPASSFGSGTNKSKSGASLRASSSSATGGSYAAQTTKLAAPATTPFEYLGVVISEVGKYSGFVVERVLDHQELIVSCEIPPDSPAQTVAVTVEHAIRCVQGVIHAIHDIFYTATPEWVQSQAVQLTPSNDRSKSGAGGAVLPESTDAASNVGSVPSNTLPILVAAVDVGNMLLETVAHPVDGVLDEAVLGDTVDRTQAILRAIRARPRGCSVLLSHHVVAALGHAPPESSPSVMTPPVPCPLDVVCARLESGIPRNEILVIYHILDPVCIALGDGRTYSPEHQPRVAHHMNQSMLRMTERRITFPPSSSANASFDLILATAATAATLPSPASAPLPCEIVSVVDLLWFLVKCCGWAWTQLEAHHDEQNGSESTPFYLPVAFHRVAMSPSVEPSASHMRSATEACVSALVGDLGISSHVSARSARSAVSSSGELSSDARYEPQQGGSCRTASFGNHSSAASLSQTAHPSHNPTFHRMFRATCDGFVSFAESLCDMVEKREGSHHHFVNVGVPTQQSTHAAASASMLHGGASPVHPHVQDPFERTMQLLKQPSNLHGGDRLPTVDPKVSAEVAMGADAVLVAEDTAGGAAVRGGQQGQGAAETQSSVATEDVSPQQLVEGLLSTCVPHWEDCEGFLASAAVDEGSLSARPSPL